MDLVNGSLLLSYIFVLAAHFGYALWGAKRGFLSLEIGPFRSLPQILGLLLLINGISLSCFWIASRAWCVANLIWHLLLAVDEAIRLRTGGAARARWPFLLNHLLFALILWAVYATLPPDFLPGLGPALGKDLAPILQSQARRPGTGVEKSAPVFHATEFRS